ncbi:MAG: glycine zipper 2TM domain-containing protein [Nitrospirota bacterium]
MLRWKKVIIILVIAFLSAGTASASPQWEGGAAGGLIGGIAGALLDHKNPWRGGVIGAGLGAIMGATIADISARGAQEAAQAGKPVEYRTERGRECYRAEPVSDVYYPNEYTRCRKVRERIWEDDRLVKDTVREICESEKTEGYGRAPYDLPPSYTTSVPPSVVLIPGTYVYAVPDREVTLLFYDGYWWRPVRGNWYRSGHHNGPWKHVRFERVPRALTELPPHYSRMLHGRERVVYREARDNRNRWNREWHGDRHEGWREGRGDRWEKRWD